MIGAAKSTIEQKDNPFAQQHQNWLAAGISPKNARRNVARSIAAGMGGVWKNGGGYQAERGGGGRSCWGRPRRRRPGCPEKTAMTKQCLGGQVHRKQRTH